MSGGRVPVAAVGPVREFLEVAAGGQQRREPGDEAVVSLIGALAETVLVSVRGQDAIEPADIVPPGRPGRRRPSHEVRVSSEPVEQETGVGMPVVGEGPQLLDVAADREEGSQPDLGDAVVLTGSAAQLIDVGPVIQQVDHALLVGGIPALASPGARQLYDHRRAVGDRHDAALRRVGYRLVSCLWHCLTHGGHYDEDRAWPS